MKKFTFYDSIYLRYALVGLSIAGFGFFCSQMNAVRPYKYRPRNIEYIAQCLSLPELVEQFHHMNDIVIPSHDVRLPHNLTLLESDKRKNEINEAALRFRWKDPEDVYPYPPHIDDFDDVRCEAGFPLQDQLHFEGNLHRSILGIRVNRMFVEKWNQVEDYHLIYRDIFLPTPEMAQHWDKDSMFGYQRLAGVNPDTIRRISSLPRNFLVDMEVIQSLLCNKSVEDEMKSGRFYLEDFAILEGIQTLPGKLLPAPMTLFYLRDNGELVPVAIQLFQDPVTSPCGTFYPTDSKIAWQFAKTAVQVALGANHQVGAHLVLTHLLAEVFQIATQRTLHSTHPVHQILQSHLLKTLDINERARDILVPKIISRVASAGVNGTFQLGGRVYDSWDFQEHFVKDLLESRGVYNPSYPMDQQPSIPRYPYRDYAIPIWDIIHTYMENLLKEFYPLENLLEDEELQAWAHEMVHKGRVKGFPERITSLEQLTDTLTMIIFTCTAQHAAVNFPQYESLGWIPNLPLALYLEEWPQSKEDITPELYFNSLPPFFESAVQVAAVRVLSRLPRDWEMLTHVPQWSDPHLQRHAIRFQNSLLELSQEIQTANAKLPSHLVYPHLDPTQIPLNVAI